MSMLFSDMVGDDGWVYAFEAAEDVYETTLKTIIANAKRNIVLFFNAVYDTKGETKFYPEPDFTRFGAYGSYGIDPLATSGRTVETITIDSMNISTPISFMKVDIQGSDLFAMRGARNTIERNRMPILFEYEEQFQKEFGTTFDDYLQFIKSIDYRIADVISGINFLIIPEEMKYDSIPSPGLIKFWLWEKIRK
jgi:FkbM family methyltransferase